MGVCVAAIAGGGLSAAAWAKPDKPVNAAQTDSGTGCLVRDANGDYHFDASCNWHTVVKLDKDGNLKSFSYQDHGQLPEDAPHPSSASKNSGDWPGCGDGFSEVTTPSGEYSSTCSTRN
jgi:hypothetical protein